VSKTKKGPDTLQGSGENERPHCITGSGLKIGEYRRIMSENVSGPDGSIIKGSVIHGYTACWPWRLHLPWRTWWLWVHCYFR